MKLTNNTDLRTRLDLGSVNPEDYIWSTSEQARIRALALYIIRCIVQKHGGTIEDIDLDNYRIDIDVPNANKRVACAQEITEKIGKLVY